MAYNEKYRFTFESSNGTDHQIKVLKNGYSGSVRYRNLGAAPVLRMQRNGKICGTSLGFNPECSVDGEFAEFYTSDPFEYKVEVWRYNNKIWTGFISPELYSEPDIAPPYDVNITATDGLGELRRARFDKPGQVSLHALFTYIFSKTGLSNPVNYISELSYTGCTAPRFFLDTEIDIDYKDGESCYDVLQYLLDTLNATVTVYAGTWLVVRENDITFDSSDRPYYINESGQRAAYNSGLMGVGSMGAADLWPIGNTDTTIDPAYNSVTITAPWHLLSGLVNSEMTSATGWTLLHASYNSIRKGISLAAATLGGNPAGSAAQTKHIVFSSDFHLSFIAAPNRRGDYVKIGIEATFLSGGVTRTLNVRDDGSLYWTTGTVKHPIFEISTGLDREDALENGIDIPVCASGDTPLEGDLTIKLYSTGLAGYLFGAYLTVNGPVGYQNYLAIDNGARGAADDVEIAVGFETDDLANLQDFYKGILLDGDGDVITSLSSAHFSNLDFLSLISRDYARSIAAPRLRTEGTVDTPALFVIRPLIMTFGQHKRWLETYSWNLLEDELQFSAVEIPSVEITVDTEERTAQREQGGGSSHGGSGGGGTGGVSSVGLTMPEPFVVSGSPITSGGTINVTLQQNTTLVQGESRNGLTPISKICICTSYPSIVYPDTLYVKIS